MWKMIIMVKSFMDKCKKDKINAYAAQSAFFILLSLIPFLMVFSSLLRYTPITEETLIKIYHAALPEYLSGFLGYITNEVYNRSVGIFCGDFYDASKQKIAIPQAGPRSCNLCNCMVCVFVCTIHLCGLF